MLNNLLRTLVICCAIFIYSSVFSSSNTIITDPTGEIYTTILGFKLEDSKLDDIRKKLGPAEIIQSGDAAESSTRINYYFPQEQTYITFNSGELGGGEYVTDVTLQLTAPDESYFIAKDVRFEPQDMGGMRLGVNTNYFVKAVAKAHKYKYEASAEFTSIVPGKKTKDLFTHTIKIRAEFKDNKITKLEISSLTVN